MPLNSKKQGAASALKDAEKNNTRGEGEAVAAFGVVDADGEWFVAKGQYPMIDAELGARFEAGVPTKAIRSSWVETQLLNGALEECDAPADAKGAKPNEALDERPTDGGEDGMGNGMQSGVTGS